MLDEFLISLVLRIVLSPAGFFANLSFLQSFVVKLKKNDL